MRKTVLMALLCVAGLSSSALAQTPYTFESRLVLDNDPMLAALGIDYGSRALLPGLSTGVGITLIARVSSTGTTANYGIAAAGGGGTTAAPNSIFTHTDGAANGDPAANFQRGFIASTGTNVGLLNYTGLGVAAGLGTQAVNFRSLIGSSADTASGNSGTQTAPTNNPYSTGANNANGYILAALSDSINAMTAQRASVANVDGTNPYRNFGAAGNDADLVAAGNQSAWYGLYHLIFVPSAGTGQVTVNYAGYLRAGTTANLLGGNWILATSSLGASNASVTFLVPTPGAAGLMGMAGLLATRRRRQV
ncbi:hypothetical protein BH11PLA1_BH11PLA1_16920 [soil metagenome]